MVDWTHDCYRFAIHLWNERKKKSYVGKAGFWGTVLFHFRPRSNSHVFNHSVVSDSVTPCTVAHQSSLSFNISQSLLRLMSIELVMPSNHLILCRSLLLPPSTFPSVKIFPNESALHNRWSKYWCFSFSISSSKEYPGLIFFRMDWFALLAVQGTLESRFQYHGLKATVLQCGAFSVVQLSHYWVFTNVKNCAKLICKCWLHGSPKQVCCPLH